MKDIGNIEELSSVTWRVPDMDCTSCEQKVTSKLEETEGISDVEASFTSTKVNLKYNTSVIDKKEIKSVIEKLGYTVSNNDGYRGGKNIWRSRRAVTSYISGLFLFIGLLVWLFIPSFNSELFVIFNYSINVSDSLLLISTFTGGILVLRDGWYSLQNFNLDIEFLMSIAILGAISIGYFEEAASLAFLFGIAELLEDYAVDRARDSIDELMKFSPDKATVIKNGSEELLSVEKVQKGDIVSVRPGEKIPVDGCVNKGDSSVNESPITGESMPVKKSESDEVFAGTINQGGYLEILTEKTSDNSVLAQIINLVEDAEKNRTEKEKFVDKFSSYYTPVIVLLAILTATVPSLIFGLNAETWFIRGLTLLVIACPCAFVISTPVSVVSAITNSAKNGVLIKGGNYLEAMGEVDYIAFDKTGTLTEGELEVSRITPVAGFDEKEVLRIASSVESYSNHPIANVINRKADEKGIQNIEMTEFKEITGKGVKATYQDEIYFVGKPDTISNRESKDLFQELENEGETVVCVGTDEQIYGYISISDEVRDNAKTVIKALRSYGIETIMMTGDNEGTAKSVAEKVGLDNYHAELLPRDKLNIINDLQSSGSTVAMVGDGVNDAPALKNSNVGISMGLIGTDVAIESSDITLMSDDLSKLPFLTRLARKSNNVIRQNIWSSLFVKLVLAVGVPFGYVTVATAVIVGDMGMSLLVTGNAIRLSRTKDN